MRTPRKYGMLPQHYLPIHLDTTELKYWLYCPIKLPGGMMRLPANLSEFYPILQLVYEETPDWHAKYIYLTAKRLWVTPGSPGNRPGWHSDGFLTDDVNYIWYDAIPTEFWHSGELHSFTADHEASLNEMNELCDASAVRYKKTYPPHTPLRLTESVLHRVAPNFEPQYRTFVKVSVSDHVYALEGNSINHDLKTDWTYKARDSVRNCPAQHAPNPPPPSQSQN